MKKILGVDAIKVLGAFMVIGLHFFANTNYYDMTIDSPIMVLESFTKWFMLSTVAMFILTTGYLQSTKRPNKKYFKKLLPIILSYVCISTIALIFKMFRGETFTVISFILSITTFEAGRYAWYVNMFIGLYLMIPFLNIIIDNISQKDFRIFLMVLMIIMSFPDTALKFMPNFWAPAYPLLFYFIGAYIRKFQIDFAKTKLLIVIFMMLIVQTCFSVFLSIMGWSSYIWNIITTVFMVIQTTSIFLLLYRWNTNKTTWYTKLITLISPLTLEILLFSGITDDYVYSIVNRFPQVQVFTYFYIPLILGIFMMLIVIAFVYKKVFNIIVSKIPYLT